MDVKVHKGEWEGLSNQDRTKIQQIISSHFDSSMKIVPEATATAAKSLIANRQLAAFNLGNPICSAACGIAEAAAVAACAVLPPLAVPLCVAAAHAAGDFCRSQCGKP